MLYTKSNNAVHVSFTVGKARVLMLTEQLQLLMENSCFFSDSTSVLKRIKNENKRFRTFLANRVSATREAHNVTQWRHIHTSKITAYDASRGMTVHQLLTKKRWLSGLEFLKGPVCSD